MNPASNTRSGGRDPAPGTKEVDTKNKKKTPNTDMQPDDAGTQESGVADRGTASEPAMKQTSKTPPESGAR